MNLRNPIAALVSVALIAGCYRIDYYYLFPDLPNDVAVLQTDDPEIGTFYVGKPIPLRFSVNLDGERFLFSIGPGGWPYITLEEPLDRKYLLQPISCLASGKSYDRAWWVKHTCGGGRPPPGRHPEEPRLRILVSQPGASDRTYEIPFLLIKAGRYTEIDSI